MFISPGFQSISGPSVGMKAMAGWLYISSLMAVLEIWACTSSPNLAFR